MVPATSLRMSRLRDCTGSFVTWLRGSEHLAGLSVMATAREVGDPAEAAIVLLESTSGAWGRPGVILLADEASLAQKLFIACSLRWHIEVDPSDSIQYQGHGHLGEIIVSREGAILVVGQPNSGIEHPVEVGLALPSCAQVALPSNGPSGTDVRAYPRWRFVVTDGERVVRTIEVGVPES